MYKLPPKHWIQEPETSLWSKMLSIIVPFESFVLIAPPKFYDVAWNDCTILIEKLHFEKVVIEFGRFIPPP